jgi:hypothetical protein
MEDYRLPLEGWFVAGQVVHKPPDLGSAAYLR